MAELQRNCFYWILGVNAEPEPAKWDGKGWVLLGGGELSDAELARQTPITFEPDVPEPVIGPNQIPLINEYGHIVGWEDRPGIEH